ncbi:metal ABC transporter permease [Candidatus Uhrbacteria bacterium]|nr:metal ABC transporter permease [Candidatus Uhrbacteria bacterium]
MEFFQFAFIQRALSAGLLMAILSSLLGVLVILRRMTFYSDAISHATLTGIALGILWGISPTIGAVAFSLLIGFLVIWFSQKKVLQADSVIGVLFSGSVALGVLLLSRVSGYKVNLINYLFGDILAVSRNDLILSAVLFVFVVLLGAVYFRDLLFVSFSRDLARVRGLKIAWWDYFFALLLSLTIALSIKIVGVILVSALIIIPATTAKLVSKNVREMVIWSIVFGVVSVFLGLVGSYYWDFPSGPGIVMVQVVLFALAWMLR